MANGPVRDQSPDLTHLLGYVRIHGPRDLGAEVIRIEHPHPSRGCTQDAAPFHGGEASISVSQPQQEEHYSDLKTPGPEVFYDLVRAADVVFDNFRAGITEKLKIDYSRLRDIKPDIIAVRCRVRQQRTVLDRPGYDYIMQGISGLMSLTGEPDAPPQKTGISVVDHVGGLYAVIAILASLVQKQRKGAGQFSDVALLDGILSFFSYVAGYFLNAGDVPKKIPASGHPSYVPVQNFETADGNIVLMPVSEKFWQGTCRAIGKPEWAEDPRFRCAADRLRNKQALLDLLIPLLKCRPSAHWLEVLAREGVPSSPINTLPEGLDHPQVKARDMVGASPSQRRDVPHARQSHQAPDKDPVYASPPF